MREVLSLIRASWRTALSYRLSMVLSLVSPKLMIEGNWRAGLVFEHQ